MLMPMSHLILHPPDISCDIRMKSPNKYVMAQYGHLQVDLFFMSI